MSETKGGVTGQRLLTREKGPEAEVTKKELNIMAGSDLLRCGSRSKKVRHLLRTAPKRGNSA